MNDASKLPRWARERIAELERELRRWQDLYVDLAMGRDPPSLPIAHPERTWFIPPGTTPPPQPDMPPAVYAYMCPFPPSTHVTGLSGIVMPGPISRPPTDREP